MVIAYASNEYKKYNPDDPSKLDGQKKPYFASRKAAIGEVITYEAIPHSPNPENGGTISAVDYGYELPITRIDGWGNAGNWLDISEKSEQEILAQGNTDELSYKSGAGPIVIKVIDPLNVPSGNFELYFTEDVEGNLEESNWFIVNNGSTDTIFSNNTIAAGNEQLIPEWGLSVWIEQSTYTNTILGYYKYRTVPIGAEMVFADSSKNWLAGYEDTDGYDPSNWIRSGDFSPTEEQCNGTNYYNPCYYNDKDFDLEQDFEDLLSGIVAPFNLVGNNFIGMPIGYPDVTYDPVTFSPSSWFSPSVVQAKVSLADIHSVDIVYTNRPYCYASDWWFINYEIKNVKFVRY